MQASLIKHLNNRFISYHDWIRGLSSEDLKAKLPVKKNKSLGEHFWCLIGARESYTRALQAGVWVGFDCSLESIESPEKIQAKLESSAQTFHQVLAAVDDWSEARQEILLQLLEHETMHEGQMIRQMLALELKLPKSVKWA